MPLSANTNVLAISVQRTLSRNRTLQEREMKSIGSGLRIERAEHDASGLSLSEGLRSQLVRLGQNVRNAEQATDLLRVAEGSLGEATAILQRMRVLAAQSANGILTDQQREVLTFEYDQAATELDHIAQATVYNKRILLAGSAAVDMAASTAIVDQAVTGVVQVALSGTERGTYTFSDDGSGATITLGNGLTTQSIAMGTLLDGSRVAAGTKVVANFDRLGIQVVLAGAGAAKPGTVGDYEAGDLDGHTLIVADTEGDVFQVGPTADSADRLAFALPGLRASGDTLDLDRVSLDSQVSARQSLAKIDQALSILSLERGQIGALLNRLDYTISFSENEIESMTASESTIRDADIARSTTELARAEILSSTSGVMLSQTFNTARQALRLL